MRIKIVTIVHDLADQTIYNITVNDQQFAVVDSVGAKLTVTFNEDHPGDEDHRFNTGERIWLLNLAMAEYDLRDTWSDVEFEYFVGQGFGYGMGVP
jgi:hypothetical protein